MGRHVTIKDVAAKAGVSYQTVSKVLNHQAQVSRETEERIWEVARSIGYRPNVIARSLRSNRSHMIGYSWAPTPPAQGNTILDQFLQGMVFAAESAGYHVLTFPYRQGEQWIDVYQELIDTNRVDGFILSSVEYDDPRIQFLQERDFPFVAFGRSNPDWDIPFVDVDGATGIYMAVEHLLSHGHRKISALAWSEDSRVGNNRMEGFVNAHHAAGIRLNPELIRRGEGVYQFGFEATSSLLALPGEKRPTAFVAFNDFMAIGAMHAVQALGLQVGNDIAITGFDDTPLIQYLTPALTSIRQPVWEIGQQVITMLMGILDEQEKQEKQILLRPQLIVRNSSGTIPV
jgi:DNA-binding LacI/PurR family transcriptional regulator